MNSAITLSHCIAVILAVGLAASAADATVVSTFDSGLDGWAKANSDSGSDVIWESTGGNPGGYLRYDEAGFPTLIVVLISLQDAYISGPIRI